MDFGPLSGLWATSGIDQGARRLTLSGLRTALACEIAATAAGSKGG